MKHALRYLALTLAVAGSNQALAASCYFKGAVYYPNEGVGSFFNCNNDDWAQVRCSRSGAMEYSRHGDWRILENETAWKRTPSQCPVIPTPPPPAPTPVHGVAGTVRTASETYFKASRDSASSLSANQKCLVPPGTAVRVAYGIYEAQTKTLKVQIQDDTLTKLGCSFGASGTIGFFFEPAVGFGRIPSFDRFCKGIGQDSAVTGNNRATGWYCLPSYFGVDADQACHEQFGYEYSAKYTNEADANSWMCVL